MNSTSSLLIARNEVASLLKIDACMNAVEAAFKMHAEGKATTPKVLGIHVSNGGFHIKAGVMNLDQEYFVTKTNANFPDNQKNNGLPTIQGVVVVCDANNGKLLAVMDSMELTIVRTGAATGVAAKYLSRPKAKVAMICGCGNQGRISIKALMQVRPLEKVYVYDIERSRAHTFAQELTEELGISILPVDEVRTAARQSDIIVTCTPSKKYFLHKEDVGPGTFIAAVGADSDDKQELQPELLTVGKLVTDLTEQCATFGEFHHALKKGIMTQANVHGQLGEIIAGQKSGRTSDEEIIVFDSTGMALQDVAAAASVYEKAIANGIGLKFNFAN